jgi:hypothetical protein
MWKGSGRSLRQTLVLENFKFMLFILSPIATAALFYNDALVRLRGRPFPPRSWLLTAGEATRAKADVHSTNLFAYGTDTSQIPSNPSCPCPRLPPVRLQSDLSYGDALSRPSRAHELRLLLSRSTLLPSFLTQSSHPSVAAALK